MIAYEPLLFTVSQHYKSITAFRTLFYNGTYCKNKQSYLGIQPGLQKQTQKKIRGPSEKQRNQIRGYVNSAHKFVCEFLQACAIAFSQCFVELR